MRNVQSHNREMMLTAQYRAQEMKTWPSPLEERMITFLNGHGILYEQQKIFYIKDDDGWIKRYYITDFFLPKDNIIIEVDGKFHDKHTQADRDRTKAIQKILPGVEVLRFKWKDLENKNTMDDLLFRVGML